MKAIQHTIEEIAWRYVFLFNTHSTLAPCKRFLDDVFSDLDYMGVDKDDKDEVRALKETKKEVLEELRRLYDLQKTLPYKIEIVFSDEFCSQFFDTKTNTYEVDPNFAYKNSRDYCWDSECNLGSKYLKIDDMVRVFHLFRQKTDIQINPFKVQINESSFLRVLLKELERVDNYTYAHIALATLGEKLKYKF